MKKITSKKLSILILGAEGMVGRIAYRYLKKKNKCLVLGTSRNPKNTLLLHFDVKNCDEDFTNILRKYKKIDFVINCIGILRKYYSIENLIAVNSLFPHKLEHFSSLYNYKLIHISSDSVFSDLSKYVNEDSPPNPIDLYGVSKYLGETTSKSSLTIRTSVIGFHESKKQGLLEWVRSSTSNVLNGYVNQIWCGCTNLQFAKLCNYLIQKNNFQNLRKRNNVFHFSPIGPVSKYTIIKNVVNLLGIKKTVKRVNSKRASRVLITKNKDILRHLNVKNNIREALEELIDSA